VVLKRFMAARLVFCFGISIPRLTSFDSGGSGYAGGSRFTYRH
jgi:hypothetical protein